MRKTKIVCTLGPATDAPEVLRGMIKSGMNVARLNFSHGTHEEHGRRIDMVRREAESLQVPLAVMLDTKGPEIRLKTFRDGKVTLQAGQTFKLTTAELEGSDRIVSVSYAGLPDDVPVGAKIMISDGLIEMTVESKNENELICRVVNGGEISDRKAVNVPGITMNMPYVSEKDIEDLLFGIEKGVDFVAASFCRSAFDAIEVKRILEKNGGGSVKIIAKIESADGVKNIDDILKVSDAIMIARGDMGVEIPFEELPRIQKMLIKKTVAAGKMVITATQMLESMIKNPRPTRAEASDVANAVYDETSAVMLSGETSVGMYPVETVKTMELIALRAEQNINYKNRMLQRIQSLEKNVTNAIAHATCQTAHDLSANAVVTFTTSGYTARMLSRFRPECPIIACTSTVKVFNQLALSWGIMPVLAEQQNNTDTLFEHAVESAQKTGLVKLGDLVVVTGGVPLGISGTTNIMKVHIVGNILVQGKGANRLSVSGKLCVAKDAAELRESFEDGDIVVIPQTDNGMLEYLKHAKAIIAEEEGLSSHAAIVGVTLEIPVICGANNATGLLRSGTTATVDATRGLVYSGITRIQ